jgi:short subunit dehydrogenase-like uncharacterized protein
MLMKIAVYGARGFQGRLVQAELRRRQLETVPLGRAEAAADDHRALVAAFTGCAAVINCAGPFLVSGLGPVRAAVTAGIPYVDTAGEQPHIRAVFDTVPSGAAPVVPATTDAGVPTDLLAHLLAKRDGPLGTLKISHVIEGGSASRGSLRSLAGVTVGSRRSSARLPGAEVDVPTVEFPLPEVVTVPRHVSVERIDAFVGGLSGPPPAPDAINLLPEGPAEPARRAQRFTYLVGDAVVQGFDTYGTTAVIAVEAARRLVGSDRRGALAPAEAFDAADFLDFLTGHRLSWRL